MVRVSNQFNEGGTNSETWYFTIRERISLKNLDTTLKGDERNLNSQTELLKHIYQNEYVAQPELILMI